MIPIPRTELLVHPLCLGGNVFGWSAAEPDSRAVLDAYAAHGGNFIDTADVYSEWVEGNAGGESEAVIGRWMKARGNRGSVVVATKVAKLSTRRGLSGANIIAACEDSLRRLQCEHIDLYYSHEDDAGVPMEETLAAYASLIAQGKVRYVAASQHTAARLEQALAISERDGLPAYVALQDHYNLLHRQPFEGAQAPVLAGHGLSMIPFFGLARGFLTGKYRPGLAVESVRAAGVEGYRSDAGWAVLGVLDELAREHGAPVAAIALAWLRAQPQVSAPIASARTVAQLEEIVQLVELRDGDLARLDAVSA